MTLAYPSAEAPLVNHVGKEAFITVPSDGNLQLEVMKCVPLNIEATFCHAINIEAYEQSLACLGTLITDQNEGREKLQSHSVCCEAVTLWRHVEELQ